jgi:hypothetical protein
MSSLIHLPPTRGLVAVAFAALLGALVGRTSDHGATSADCASASGRAAS